MIYASLAATLFLTGVAWSLQFVQLPVLLRADSAELWALHRRLNTRLMMLPIAIEFVTAVWLAIYGRSRAAFVAAMLLWCVAGFATLGYTMVHPRGYRWNLLRALAWTGRSAILLWIVTGVSA